VRLDGWQNERAFLSHFVLFPHSLLPQPTSSGFAMVISVEHGGGCKKNKSHLALILGVSIAGVLVIGIVTVVLFLWLRRRAKLRVLFESEDQEGEAYMLRETDN
jgi:hypothetical protein